jgi:hypothetical protein
MVGTTQRSGGHNRKSSVVGVGDGKPQSPRDLDAVAADKFDWLMERIGANRKGSPFCRADGAVIAALAELLASQEAIATVLSREPDNDKFLRLRLNYAVQISRYSALLGLCPRDRERQPTTEDPQDADPVLAMLSKMQRSREVN